MNKDDFKEIIKNRFGGNKKLIVLLIIGFIGIGLIALSEVKPTDSKDTQTNSESDNGIYYADEYAENLEKRLTDIISSIENTGSVKVMVTLESTFENVYAVEETVKDSDNSKSYQSKYVIVDNKSVKEGISLKINEPVVKGVAVVCTGGGDPTVVENVTKTVCTVLGIGSNRVSVIKMKYGG